MQFQPVADSNPNHGRRSALASIAAMGSVIAASSCCCLPLGRHRLGHGRFATGYRQRPAAAASSQVTPFTLVLPHLAASFDRDPLPGPGEQDVAKKGGGRAV